ncbi:MAG: cytochrome c biogenesis protein CcsA [Gammaproteobacteria bacterium]|nr:cytochrome c biogenesis protein CcsA [Gammaproteobacteria bacterium]
MFNIITILLYVAGSITQAYPARSIRHIRNTLLFVFVIPAIILHGDLLYKWIDLTQGQNLTVYNLFSLATWLTTSIIIFIALFRPIGYLAILILPLAALSILLAGNFPSSHIINTAAQPKQFLHILLSVATFSVLLIAGLQAVTLAFQEKLLKQKNFEISQTLPPIETMEKQLFQMIIAGSILLGLVLITSIYFFHTVLLQQFLQKTILTFAALCVFVLLLIGRHYFGWRGKKAIYCTLSGFGILSIIYFSSMIIMELLP